MAGIFLLYKKWFNIQQYGLRAVFGTLVEYALQLLLLNFFGLLSFDHFYNKMWLIWFVLSIIFLFYHSSTKADIG